MSEETKDYVMEPMYCDQREAPLEDGRIGLCDDCCDEEKEEG